VLAEVLRNPFQRHSIVPRERRDKRDPSAEKKILAGCNAAYPINSAKSKSVPQNLRISRPARSEKSNGSGWMRHAGGEEDAKETTCENCLRSDRNNFPIQAHFRSIEHKRLETMSTGSNHLTLWIECATHLFT
jgi:hypothetical protein